MLHRSYSLLSFIRRNVTCHCTDRFYVFHIGANRRHTSIYITPKFVHVILNTQNIFNNANRGKISELRWIHASASRFSAKEIEERKAEKLKVANLKQKVIELDQEKLGKVKERDLTLSVTSLVDDLKKQDEKSRKKEEKRESEKEAAKEEIPVPKKGKILNSLFFTDLKNEILL